MYHIKRSELQIPHDTNRNYADTTAENYIPPYRNGRQKSVYWGMQIEIQIIDHCNLNCTNCNHFCPTLKPWLMSMEEFQENILAIKENIPVIKTITLLGGEPTLHPQLAEMCAYVRNTLPEVEIIVFTNGVNLTQLFEKKNIFKENNVAFHFTIYPDYTKQNDIIEFMEDYDNLDILEVRIAMNESLVATTQQDADFNFYNCTHHAIPCFSVKNKRLYICPFSTHVNRFSDANNLNIPDDDLNSLALEDIKGDMDKVQDFCFTPKPICGYCEYNSHTLPWNKSSKEVNEYFEQIFDLYYNNYDKYLEQMIRGPFKEVDDRLLSINCYVREQYETNYIYKRYHGKMDIIIPYYQVTEQQRLDLFNSLKNQTIIRDCVIYLISDNSPNEQEMFQTFFGQDLNVIFLKNQTRMGPGEARNNGIKHSYNQNILCFDADDYFISNDALEKLYNFKTQQNKEICNFIMVSDDYTSPNIKTNYLFNRSLIQQKNLYFFPLFFSEDFSFYLRLIRKTEQCFYSDLDIAIWRNYNNYDSLTHLSIQDDESELNQLINNILLLFYYIAERDFSIDTINTIQRIYSIYLSTSNKYCKILSYYTLYKVYQIINQKYFILLPLQMLENFCTHSLSIFNLNSEKEIQTFLVNTDYRNNLYFSQIMPILYLFLEIPI